MSPPKTIEYQSYENFGINSFLYDLDQEFAKRHMYQNRDFPYDTFTNLYQWFINMYH